MQADYFIPNRPLVLLAGWLGSKTRHLRLYAKVYERLGYNVLMRIPSPVMVVLASQGITRKSMGSRRVKTATISDMATETIRDILKIDPSMLIVHVFSNGGCFLWDAMENELKTDSEPPSSSLKRLTRGIVFDSSPADYRGTDEEVENIVNRVLMHCSLKERLFLKIELFYRGETLNSGSRAAKEFWDRRKNCEWVLPQLYFFSEDDALTPSRPLRELIVFRKQKFGNLIRSKSFSSSAHCGHIIKHPDDYIHHLTIFLEFCSRHYPSRQGSSSFFRSRL